MSHLQQAVSLMHHSLPLPSQAIPTQLSVMSLPLLKTATAGMQATTTLALVTKWVLKVRLTSTCPNPASQAMVAQNLAVMTGPMQAPTLSTAATPCLTQGRAVRKRAW